jgi:hypothetical protein
MQTRNLRLELGLSLKDDSAWLQKLIEAAIWRVCVRNLCLCRGSGFTIPLIECACIAEGIDIIPEIDWEHEIADARYPSFQDSVRRQIASRIKEQIALLSPSEALCGPIDQDESFVMPRGYPHGYVLDALGTIVNELSSLTGVSFREAEASLRASLPHCWARDVLIRDKEETERHELELQKWRMAHSPEAIAAQRAAKSKAKTEAALVRNSWRADRIARRERLIKDLEVLTKPERLMYMIRGLDSLPLDAIPSELVPLDKSVVAMLKERDKLYLIAAIDRRRGVWRKLKSILLETTQQNR